MIIGNELWSGAENHRLGVYFTSFLECEMGEDEIFKDVALKRELIRTACEVENPMPDDVSLSPEVQKYWNRLMNRFCESNKNLELCKYRRSMKLPDEYFQIS